MKPASVIFLVVGYYLSLLGLADSAAMGSADKPVAINATYDDFWYTESLQVGYKQLATLKCSGTFPLGTNLGWYRKSTEGIFIEVRSDYWKELGMDYEITESVDYSNSFCVTKLKIKNMKEKYIGLYVCKPTLKDKVLIRSNEIQVNLSNKCLDPTVGAIAAEWIDDSNSILVSWDVSPPTKINWCRGNKIIWSVRYYQWEQVNHIPDDLSVLEDNDIGWSEWKDLLNKRQKSTTFSELKKSKYYLFQIGWRLKHQETLKYNASSILHAFEQQVGARIVRVGSETTSNGRKLYCEVDGIPKPKVLWTTSTDASLGTPLGDSGPTPVAPFFSYFSIKSVGSKKYTCIVRNTIVRDGKKQRFIKSITVPLVR